MPYQTPLPVQAQVPIISQSGLHLQPLNIEDPGVDQTLRDGFLSAVPTVTATITVVQTWLGIWLKAMGVRSAYGVGVEKILERLILDGESVHRLPEELVYVQIRTWGQGWKDKLVQDIMIVRARAQEKNRLGIDKCEEQLRL